MKKLTVFLCIMALMPTLVDTAHAVPVSLTFSGSVIEVAVDDPAVDVEVTVGYSTSYTVLIDFDRLGTQASWDGTQYVIQELDAATFGIDTFYVEYVDGFLIDDSLISEVANPDLVNYGYAFFGSNMFMGSQNHSLVLSTLNGTNWSAVEQAYDSNGAPDLISITSSVSINVIPEPATMLLLGSGLVGLVGFRRKKK